MVLLMKQFVSLLRILILSFLLCMIAMPSAVTTQAIGETDRSSDASGELAPFSISAGLNLWVDAVSGNDSNNGLSQATAFHTIQHAAELAEPGTTVHILPGVYREAVVPAQSGTAAGTIRYVSEGGPRKAVIRGSDPSSALQWTRLTSNIIGLPSGVAPENIYYADLSTWGLTSAPRFVAELDGAGEVVARLPLAREPDWSVVTDWKYHEFWWAADGGKDVAGCNPLTDPNPISCDAASRSFTQLTDRHNDADPAGIEAGNLTTLGNLTGATLVALDTDVGGYIFHRTIVSHDVTAGRITVDENAADGSQPALGWGSKYYVENLPRLLDSPGEWWYDQGSGRLYLWPPASGDPAAQNIEISRRTDGFLLRDRSYITLDGLTIEFFNRQAVYARNNMSEKSHSDVVRNALLRYADNGVWLSQWVDPNTPVDSTIDGFVLEDSEIAFMDSRALNLSQGWGTSAEAAAFTRPGVLNTVIRGNEMHHLGFRAEDDNDVGVIITFADHLQFTDNHIHDVARDGVQFMRSVVQSTKDYGFTPSEIKTGDILIRDNIFEKACQTHSDCGALMISGSSPDRHVFRNLLLTGNIFRDTFGWTYVAEKRGHFGGGGLSSPIIGMGGYGLYVNNASGIYAYRNIAYNNAFAGFKFAAGWRDGYILFFNNTVANSLFGFHFGGWTYDTHSGSVNTQLVNNIIVNQESYGMVLSDANGVFENTNIDNNLYYNNGWRPTDQGGAPSAGDLRLNLPSGDRYYPTLQDIHDGGINFDAHGVEGDPAFWNYNFADHDLSDNSWPDLRPTSASTTVIDKGVASLPGSFSTLLNLFAVKDPHWGTAFDIGRYEAGFALESASGAVQHIEPGGVAHFTLRLYPSDLPYPVTLQVTTPSPRLNVTLTPLSLTSNTTAALTITDTGGAQPALPGVWFDIHVSGGGSGFTNETVVKLLIGGVQLYLPLTLQK
jgi:hypothetical protein